MNDQDLELLFSSTGAQRLLRRERVQELWSGYGQIERVFLEGGSFPSVIVKNVSPPSIRHHPRGWSSDRSHQRKLRSYEVELAWYRDWSSACPADCRVPGWIASDQSEDHVFLVLEDLNAAGYPQRRQQVSQEELHRCLRWLARFHAQFLGRAPQGLWEQGCYWHLATRPDELERLEDRPLKAAAAAIDQALSASPFQSLLHGDAKLANFCFGPEGVAAVDFQYVGGGCGMKDVAYFLGSCLNEHECEKQEQPLLDLYFAELSKRVSGVDTEALEQDWRSLYPVAWADFHRFLKGWSPGHWKINSYSERICRQVVKQLCS